MASRSGDGSQVRLGVVASFESGRGLGTVTELDREEAQGTEGGHGERAGGQYRAARVTYMFHSTAIADGSRKIEPGTAVAFVVVPGHGGTLEAAHLRQVSAGRDRLA